MDSLSQLVLGAAVGEAVAGKKIGNKAILWGAIAGTIPDLDILLNPWLGMVEELSFHRSVTHSFLFAIVVSPILGYVLWRRYHKQEATFTQWSLLFFLAFTTHAILDSFTTWGTQLLWPFSKQGIAFYNISVVDPFYTLPLLVGILAAAFYSRKSSKRSLLNYIGLGLSSAYICFTFYAKSLANEVFEESLTRQGITYKSYISKPTPFNSLLWSVTAETDDGFYTGFYSLLDENETIAFDYESKKWDLLAGFRGQAKLEKLLDITRGYYTVHKGKDAVYINDLRFGKFDGWRKTGGQYVFVYQVKLQEKELVFKEINYRPKPDAAYGKSFLNRILGKEEGKL